MGQDFESRYRLLKGDQLGPLSYAVIAQLVEQRLPKPQVAGSSPVYRSAKNSHPQPAVAGYSAKASSCACRAPFTALKVAKRLRNATLLLRNGASAYENEDENEKHYPTLDVKQYNL